MYHIQHLHLSSHEMSFSAVWRGILSFFHKIILAVQESRRSEAERILDQFRKDRPKLFSTFD